MTEQLIDQIYEAAFLPEVWKTVLDDLSTRVGAIGGSLTISGDAAKRPWIATERMTPAMTLVASGGHWDFVDMRARYFVAGGHSGFMRDIEVYGTTREVIERTRFDTGDGWGWKAGTAIPMPGGDAVMMLFDRPLDDGPHDFDAVQALNSFAPHVSRSFRMAAKLSLARSAQSVETLAALGLAAAVLDRSGRMRAANGLFDAFSEVAKPAAHGHLAISDSASDIQLKKTLADLEAGNLNAVCSIPVRALQSRRAVVLHVMPVRGQAYDL